MKFADVGGKDVLAEGIAGAKALRRECVWRVEKEQGDQCGWSGVNEGRVLGDGLGDSLEPDVRPSTGTAQLLKTGASTSFHSSNDLFSFTLPSNEKAKQGR